MAELNRVPSVAAYTAALQRLQPELKASWVAMLKAHATAPRHTLTTSQLAKIAQFKTYHAVNLQYGRFGTLLASEIGYRPGQASSSFASFTRTTNKAHWRWHLRPTFVQAMHKLGWVSR